jgi:putative transcriptional regulator
LRLDKTTGNPYIMLEEEFECDAAKAEGNRQRTMSKKNTIVARRQSDGTMVQVMPDGSSKPFEDKTDWARLRAMTDEEVTAAALADPDAQPMTPERRRTARRVPRAKTLRRALAMTQEEFASRYHIPLGTLRDWEQGRCEPDQPARAYLTVIAHDPEGVKRALLEKHL